MKQPTRLMNRNYAPLWLSQTVSLLGVQVFGVAMVFWIKHATGSATIIGLLQMLAGLPAVLLAPIGGVLADRYSRRWIIVLGDLLRGGAVLSLALVAFLAPDSDATLIWLFVVAVLVSAVGAIFLPTLNASIPDLVPGDRVVSANSMIQLSTQLSIFIGQGLGGLLFRLLGAPALFLINGCTYALAAAGESWISVPQPTADRPAGWQKQLVKFKSDILQGFRFVWDTTGLRELVFVSAFLAFFTTPVLVLLPFYIEDVLQVEADWYGFLLAAYGVGSLLGYLLVGALKLPSGTRSAWLIVFILLESSGYGLLGVVREPILAVGLAVVGGIAGGFATVSLTTIMQLVTPSAIRGRVFGLVATLTGSLYPLAAGLTGVVADLLNQNIPLIYLGSGVIMLLLTAVVSLNKEFRAFLAYEGGDLPSILQETTVPLD